MINTGDVILTSDVSLDGYIVHLFLSAVWNHVGIAIRIKNGKVTKDLDGDLHVFEISPMSRQCPIWGDMITGCGFTLLSKLTKYYDKVSVRKMNSKYLTSEFCYKANEFITETRGKKFFPNSVQPMADIWLGVQKQDDIEKTEIFCSEMLAYFYEYTLGSHYRRVHDKVWSTKVLVGEMLAKNVIRPDSFTGQSEILEEQFIISQRNQSTLMMSSRPLLFIIFVCVAVYACLP